MDSGGDGAKYYHGDRDETISQSINKLSELQTPRFYDRKEFPFSKILEENWQEILKEFKQLHEHHFCPWPERGLYYTKVKPAEPSSSSTIRSPVSKAEQITEGVGWNVFGLYAFGKKHVVNCEICPVTARLVEEVGALTAAFSVLNPDSHIVPHSGYFGYSDKVLRVHLGLVIPEDTPENLSREDSPGSSSDAQATYKKKGFPVPLGIRVVDDLGLWTPGECMVFDDLHIHTAWNFTKQPRAVLLLDVPRPGKYLSGESFTSDQAAYLDKLTAAFGY